MGRQFGAHSFQHVFDETDNRERRIALFTGAYSNIRDGVSLTLNKMVAFLEQNGHEFEIFAPTPTFFSFPASPRHLGARRGKPWPQASQWSWRTPREATPLSTTTSPASSLIPREWMNLWATRSGSSLIPL